mmetsp:Transcript_28008/g.64638  ORF Transcript_28008/g.64638 Transcript_28008/m.64638 type:complete len:460 (+) Transcript_28008:68-1447(+)
MERVATIAAHVCASDGSQGAKPVTAPVRRPYPFGAKGDQPITLTLLAGGNSGHVCAALIEENTGGRVKTQLLTSRPSAWKKNPKVTFPDGSVQVGNIHRISDNPADLIPESDIILWTGPVWATKDIFENIRPYFNPRRTAIGTIFAQGLVHLLAYRTFGPEVHFFALRNIPWLCRLTKMGEECEIVGVKTALDVITLNLTEEWVKKWLEPMFVAQKMGKWEPVMNLLPDFCPIVFNPANQIIHPARYWAIFRNWHGAPLKGKEEPGEWLYRGFDEVAGNMLQVLDEELQQLKDAYHAATGAEGCKSVVPLARRLQEQYGDQIEDNSTLATMVGTNKAYSMAKTPFLRSNLGVMPNPTHRVVLDDIGWGLCVLVSIAERLEVAGIRTPTTMMRTMVEWHQQMMGKEFLFNGRLRGRDCNDLVLLRSDDPLELVAKVPLTSTKAWLSWAEDQADEYRIGNP